MFGSIWAPACALGRGRHSGERTPKKSVVRDGELIIVDTRRADTTHTDNTSIVLPCTHRCTLDRSGSRYPSVATSDRTSKYGRSCGVPQPTPTTQAQPRGWNVVATAAVACAIGARACQRSRKHPLATPIRLRSHQRRKGSHLVQMPPRDSHAAWAYLAGAANCPRAGRNVRMNRACWSHCRSRPQRTAHRRGRLPPHTPSAHGACAVASGPW